jgi:chromosome segregation ATPase
MGCSNTRELAIKELNQMIMQISKENAELEKERDRLKPKKSGKIEEEQEKDTVEDILKVQLNLEKELNKIEFISKNYLQQSNTSTNTLSAKILDLLQIKENLDQKTEKARKMLNEKNSLRKNQSDLEVQIKETEEKIAKMEDELYGIGDIKSKYHDIHTTVAELETERQELTTQITEAELILAQLNQEISSLGGFQANKIDDTSMYMLTIATDEEINNHIAIVDKELEELNEEIKELKSKEYKIQSKPYIGVLSPRLMLKKDSGLNLEIKNSQERINVLEAEKKKISEEIMKFKRNSYNYDGVNTRISELNQIINNKKHLVNDNKSPSKEFASGIEETLKRARELQLITDS